jgi:hypothetical protein
VSIGGGEKMITLSDVDIGQIVSELLQGMQYDDCCHCDNVFTILTKYMLELEDLKFCHTCNSWHPEGNACAK